MLRVALGESNDAVTTETAGTAPPFQARKRPQLR